MKLSVLILSFFLLSVSPSISRYTGILHENDQTHSPPEKDSNFIEINKLIPLLKLNSSNSTFSDSGVVLSITQTGLSYLKNIVVEQVIKELTPLIVPNITIQTSSYFLPLEINITDIILYEFVVPEAAIQLSNGIITMYVDNILANISSNWSVLYGGYIGDSGNSIVEVSGMQVGVSFELFAENGTLRMNIIQNGVIIDNLFVWLDSYASWIYNWLIWGFQSYVKSAVETAVNAGVVKASLKLNNYLQSMPRIIDVDSISAVDASIYQDPVVEYSFLSFSPRGQFLHVDKPEKDSTIIPSMPAMYACSDQNDAMVAIAISEYVANSAASVYYEAGALSYLLDHLPDSAPLKLTTSSWKYILPRLYLKYPSANITLLFQVSKQPLISFYEKKVFAAIVSDIFINVYSSSINSTAVACLNMDLRIEANAAITNQNITGEVDLIDLSLSLLWSNIGIIHVKAVQTVILLAVKSVVLPAMNAALSIGFPLPSIPLFSFTNSSLVYGDSYLLVCTNVEYNGELEKVLVKRHAHPWNGKKRETVEEKEEEEEDVHGDGDESVLNENDVMHDLESRDGEESQFWSNFGQSGVGGMKNGVDKSGDSREERSWMDMGDGGKDVMMKREVVREEEEEEEKEFLIEMKVGMKHLLMVDVDENENDKNGDVDKSNESENDDKEEEEVKVGVGGENEDEENEEEENTKMKKIVSHDDDEDQNYVDNENKSESMDDKESMRANGNEQVKEKEEEEEEDGVSNNDKSEEDENINEGQSMDKKKVSYEDEGEDEEDGDNVKKDNESDEESNGNVDVKNLNEIEKELDSILKTSKGNGNGKENDNNDKDKSNNDGNYDGNNDVDANHDKIKIQKEMEKNEMDEYNKRNDAELRDQVKHYRDSVKSNEVNDNNINDDDSNSNNGSNGDDDNDEGGHVRNNVRKRSNHSKHYIRYNGGDEDDHDREKSNEDGMNSDKDDMSHENENESENENENNMNHEETGGSDNDVVINFD